MNRFLLLLFGLIVCGIGIGVLLFSNLGVDPASVFQTGLSKTFDISYGTASALSNIIIIVIILIVDKSYINIATLLAIFSIGYSADFTLKIINSFLTNEYTLLIKIIISILGTLIIGAGVALYTRANLGVGAIDAVSELLTDKTKIEYRIVRIIADGLFLLVGYLIGGTVGKGTVIVTVLTGPTVQYIRKIMDRRKFFKEEVV